MAGSIRSRLACQGLHIYVRIGMIRNMIRHGRNFIRSPHAALGAMQLQLRLEIGGRIIYSEHHTHMAEPAPEPSAMVHGSRRARRSGPWSTSMMS
jgi:hypothetical protein